MNKQIRVVGLGPGSAEYLTLSAVEALRKACRVVLRTERHGISAYLKEQGIPFDTLDYLYNEVQDFDELNEKIADFLISRTEEGNSLVYGVPGHGIMGDATVLRLLDVAGQAGIQVDTLPGISAVDHAISLAALNLPDQLQVLPAVRWEKFRPDPRTPLLVTEVDHAVKASELKLRLLEHYPAEHMVTVLWLGEVEQKKSIPLSRLDRLDCYDHTLALLVPPVSMEKLESFDFYHLVEIMELLRNPEGCPWDREQDHRSLKQYMIEEAYEVLEAIDEEDVDKLVGELGDVMLQVVFHAQIATEKREFDISHVLTGICRKMIERHTHIFGEAKVDCADQVVSNWEAIKKKEKGLTSHTQVLRDIPSNLPALMRSYKVQEKAALVGFDWDHVREAMVKVEEEVNELKETYLTDSVERMTDELGDLLFAAVNVARFLKVHPELALTATTEKFIRRFQYIEDMSRQKGRELQDMSLNEMDELWNEAKKVLKS